MSNSTKKKKIEKKLKGAEKFGKHLQNGPNGQILPPFFFSFFLLCVICAVILNTINLDVMAIFVTKIRHFYQHKSRFIVFKMTAQITQTQQKRKKLKKMKRGQDQKENGQNLTIWPFWGILDTFSLISWPPFIFFNFLLFDSVCVICSVF